jgi:hypothetical protein
MPYGYLGQTPNQQVKNSGVFSVGDAKALTDVGQLGGSLELIEEQTVSSVANVEFTNLGNYDVHYLTVDNLKVVNDNVWLQVRFYESGVLETASVYQFAEQVGTSTGTFYEARSSANGYIQFMVGANVGNATNESGNAYCYFYNLTNSAKYSFLTNQCVVTSPSTNANINYGGGCLPQASEVTGIQLLLSSGNISSATMKLYGVKQ